MQLPQRIGGGTIFADAHLSHAIVAHHTGTARMQRLTANFADGGNDLQNRKAYIRPKITRLDEAGVTELPDGRLNTKAMSRVELQAEVDALDAVQRRGRPVSTEQESYRNASTL